MWSNSGVAASLVACFLIQGCDSRSLGGNKSPKILNWSCAGSPGSFEMLFTEAKAGSGAGSVKFLGQNPFGEEMIGSFAEHDDHFLVDGNEYYKARDGSDVIMWVGESGDPIECSLVADHAATTEVGSKSAGSAAEPITEQKIIWEWTGGYIRNLQRAGNLATEGHCKELSESLKEHTGSGWRILSSTPNTRLVETGGSCEGRDIILER